MGKGFADGTETAITHPDGFIGGGQAGCDYQLSNWLVGLQGDFTGGDLRDTSTISFFPNGVDRMHTEIHWIATTTARVGYAWDHFLLYGKGGLAWVKDSFHEEGGVFAPPFPFVDLTGNDTRRGWTAGGGLEWMFAPNWSASAEYDYYAFGTSNTGVAGQSCTGIPIPVCGPLSGFLPLKQNEQAVKIGINYHFGASASLH